VIEYFLIDASGNKDKLNTSLRAWLGENTFSDISID